MIFIAFCQLCHLKKKNPEFAVLGGHPAGKSAGICWRTCFPVVGFPPPAPRNRSSANTEGGLGLLFVCPAATGLIQVGRGTIFTGMLLPRVQECSLKGVFLPWICTEPLLNTMECQYLGCPGWRGWQGRAGAHPCFP